MARPSITLVQYPGDSRRTTMSPPCGKVHMALALKGLAYDVKNVENPWQARRYNPRGRVPALLCDGEVVVDSSDIVAFLDRRFPDPPLFPADPGARAMAKIWEDWADEVLYFYLVGVRWCIDANFANLAARIKKKVAFPVSLLLPTVARSIARGRAMKQGIGLKDEATIHRELSDCLDALEQALSGRSWLVADALTHADVAVGAVVDQFRQAQLTPEAARLVEQRAGIVAWAARLHERVPAACP